MNKGVLEKLILFSIAIVVLPLGLLYGSLHGYLDREALNWSIKMTPRENSASQKPINMPSHV